MFKKFFSFLGSLFAESADLPTAAEESAAPVPVSVRSSEFPPPITKGGHFPPEATHSAADLDILARTIWGEARGEGVAGMTAVAHVIKNRWKLRQHSKGYVSFGPKFASIAEICKQKWQFSCWDAGDPNRARLLAVTPADREFKQAQHIAAAVLSGKEPDAIYDPTNGADHYHTKTVTPDWSKGQAPVAEIGNHLFFKLT